MLEEIKKGLQSYRKAHELITQKGLWKYMLVPGFVFCLIFVLVVYLGIKLSAHLMGYVETMFEIDEQSWIVLIYLMNAAKYAVSFIIKSSFIVLFFWCYKNFMLIILSPLFAYISERTDTILTGNTNRFNLSQFLKDVLRGVLLSSRNIIIEFSILIILTMFTSIPLVGLAGFIFIFILQSYFFGFAMIDYSNERKKLSLAESIQFVRRNKMMAIVNGAIFFCLFAIPLIGWAVAPIYAVVAATAAMTEKDIEQKELQEVN